ncbi:MAG: NUDIX domain-containing protein [Puniceicoccales bacterium]|jgi:isopentenyl-diphosphate delta-isomerase type 1|nr:NUDIX domain-containing protein [Puniceicoccales bacterium]
MQAQNPDELFDVVDADDRVIGQNIRSEVHRLKLMHRAVHVFVFDSNGRVYLQKRSMLKDTCPGLYTTSCAGHVDAGETYDIAVVRELDEELGIRLPLGALPQLLFKESPREEIGWEFVQVYRLDWTGGITPNPVEISGDWWGGAEELDAWMLRDPEMFSPSLSYLWQIFRKNSNDAEA